MHILEKQNQIKHHRFILSSMRNTHCAALYVKGGDASCKRVQKKMAQFSKQITREQSR